MTNTSSNDRNFFSAADGSVNVETAFTHISGLLMQVFISVHHNVFWKKFTVFSYILEGLFLFFFLFTNVVILLCFYLSSLKVLIDALGLKCGVAFAFCFAFYGAWCEWRYL